MQDTSTPLSLEITREVLASSWKRFGTFIIDLIIRVFLVSIIWLVAIALSAIGSEGLMIWLQNVTTVQDLILSNIVLILYYIIMESTTQRTIGKYITGTRVMMEDGSKPEARVIVIRTLCRYIPFDPFSFLGEKSRGWHDSIPNIYVIDIKKYNEALEVKNSFEQIGTEEI